MAVKNKAEKIRYTVVGSFNTVVDFGLLFILSWLGLPVIAANITSSTTAFIVSFVANKKFTFKTTDTNVKREIILFVIVTLFGLWVLQSIIILAVKPVVGLVFSDDNLILLFSKLAATAVTLVWNYVLYSRVVFKQNNSKS